MARPQATYDGLRSACGAPMTILNNGSQAVDAENWELNQYTYDTYLWRLLDVAMSVFQWKNLPKGVDPRMLELWLLTNGFCVFFYDEALKEASKNYWTAGKAPEGYAVLQGMIGGHWDMYNYPTNINAYSVNGMNIRLTPENAVIIYNDYLRVPMWATIQLYAYRLAELERTIDVNIRAQKTPKVLRCDKAEQLTFKNLVKEIDGNQYAIFANKNLDLKSIEVLDLTAPYVAGDLNYLKHQIWNEALTYLGVENVSTEKKDRLVSNEVMAGMGDVEAQRFTRLNARKWACEQINELFGLDVDCEFRSGVYIKADGYGAQEIITNGMKTDIDLNREGRYSGDDSPGVMAALKKLLGGMRK